MSARLQVRVLPGGPRFEQKFAKTRPFTGIASDRPSSFVTNHPLMKETPMSHLILALDAAGGPHRWIDFERAAYYYAKGLVLWSVGERDTVLHGGLCRTTGERSRLGLNSIIALKGKDFIVRNYDREPVLSKEMLLARDRYLCAY